MNRDPSLNRPRSSFKRKVLAAAAAVSLALGGASSAQAELHEDASYRTCEITEINGPLPGYSGRIERCRYIANQVVKKTVSTSTRHHAYKTGADEGVIKDTEVVRVRKFDEEGHTVFRSLSRHITRKAVDAQGLQQDLANTYHPEPQGVEVAPMEALCSDVTGDVAYCSPEDFAAREQCIADGGAWHNPTMTNSNSYCEPKVVAAQV